ncbi:uncharacterized protein Z520_04169 [Fonsecaea multimorphosa CBS 102226]|uniref:Kinetochore protein fta4 n=1 Tax=Fonsecaea multimorphosa CBS 102226 TaxID=1442371 RepID=A0A0D2KUT6_9EURO|nr:uncharacterized protein Z520_04169 [Fonsecaea multimorphosa CBS 102226]KIY00484.1 hypothetical protein Z520_04169 [Fonsecaea multimorphosa CBS 102226]OAL26998.1 hypothetical protein AYO22_03942 [Fonsecaea multimorphosa]
MDEPSITALKAAFIRSQVRQLETPLKRYGYDEGARGDKFLQDLVSKVNDKIKQHNRLIFSTQSQRHVAEQIESLYWARASADSSIARAELDTLAIRRDADLTDTDVIVSLPQDYRDLFLHPDHETRAAAAAAEEEQEQQQEEGERDADADRYADMREELHLLSQQRDALKAKLAKYRYLQRLTEPLREQQSLENIPPNHLIARLGAMERETDRMNALMDRITTAVEGMIKAGSLPTIPKAKEAPRTDRQKLAQVMNRTGREVG